MAALLLAASCSSKPATPPEEILGRPVAEDRYQAMSCKDLDLELEFLHRRDRQLAEAQRSSYRNSQINKLVWGHTKGDGPVAEELAQVRGELEAIRRVLARKNCPR